MQSELAELRRKLCSEMRNSLEGLSDTETLHAIEQAVWAESAARRKGGQAQLRCDDFGKWIADAFCALRRELGILQPYADDPTVCEIMVNGADTVFVERCGRIEAVQAEFVGPEEVEELARRLAARAHREINELSPIVDARLRDGARFHAVAGNVAIGGPVLNIRRFPERSISMDDWISQGSLTKEAALFLERAVKAGLNLFLAGGTSSGKTTFLNALSAFIPPSERVIVVEDAAELRLQGLSNLVRLETKNANTAGKGAITMSELIRSSLRMRPDRIIVGEVRGEEVLEMVQAMNTGHDGSLSTGHGNSPKGMLGRLEAMYLSARNDPLPAVREQLSQAIDAVVFLGRMADGSRKVLEITELQGLDENYNYVLNPLFKYEFEKGLQATGNKPTRTDKAMRRGITLMD